MRNMVSAPRTAALLAIALTLLASIGTGVASADARNDYRAYATIRERLMSCSLDRTWHQLGPTQRRLCRTRYRKLYLLYTFPGESNNFHVHCRKAKPCPPQPFEEPDPRAAIPQGSTIFR